jgi:uncharacterized protein
MAAESRLCPADGSTLVAVERSGVVIDACPTCRGLWLDRGELDKLVEIEAARDEDFLNEVTGGRRERPDRKDSHDDDHDAPRHGSDKRKAGPQRRRSILDSFLDFGGD